MNRTGFKFTCFFFLSSHFLLFRLVCHECKFGICFRKMDGMSQRYLVYHAVFLVSSWFTFFFFSFLFYLWTEVRHRVFAPVCKILQYYLHGDTLLEYSRSISVLFLTRLSMRRHHYSASNHIFTLSGSKWKFALLTLFAWDFVVTPWIYHFLRVGS